MNPVIDKEFFELAKAQDIAVQGSVKILHNHLVFKMLQFAPSVSEAIDILFFIAHPTSGLLQYSKDTIRKKAIFNLKKNKGLRRNTKEEDLHRHFVMPCPAEEAFHSTFASQTSQTTLPSSQTTLASSSGSTTKAATPSSALSLRKRLNEKAVLVAELGERNKLLHKEAKVLQKELSLKDLQLSKERQKLKAVRMVKESEHRNATKKVYRRDIKISELEQKNCELQDENVSLTEQLVKSSKASEANKTLRKKISALKQKIKHLKIDYDNTVQTTEELNAVNEDLQKEVDSLQQCVDFLEKGDVPKSKMQTKTETDRAYVHSIRRTCMELACRFQVSVRKVSDVVKLVLDNLTDIQIDKTSLPSKSTIQNFFVEANAIAKHHVAQELLEDFDPTDLVGNVSHSDATSKHHKHYQGNQATKKSGEQLSIGLHEVASGDAAAYTEVFKQVVEDLAEASLADTEKIKGEIISSFKATMTDRCAVNGVLTDNIQGLRAELIPKIVPDFKNLPEEKQQDILYISRHACRMHLLANFAMAADKGVLAFETAICSGSNPHSFKHKDQSGSLRLIRTCAKAFTERGCDRSGVNHFFDPFLKERQRSNHLLTYLGHRFNVMFIDAAAVFYHKHDIKTFLEQWPNPNQLLQSISFDINQKVFIAGSRALGIMSKKVTEPFAEMIKGKKILEINDDLALLQSTLDKWSEDAADAFVEGSIFKCHSKPTSPVTTSLFQPTNDPELDSYTQLALEMISAEMLVLLERQAETQLPGGHLASPSPLDARASSNVPADNMVAERDMASLDNILKLRPSAAISTIEACLMWQTNRPDVWLNKQANEDEVFMHARKIAFTWRKKYVDRVESLKKEKLKRLKDKQQEKENKEAAGVETRLKIVKEVEACGGVWDEKNLQDKLDSVPDSAVLKMEIVSQLKFHKNVTGAQGPRHLFQQSLNGQAYHLETLAENLRTILQMNYRHPVSNSGIKYKETNEYLDKIQEQKRKIFSTLLDNRKKRQNLQQVNSLLPLFLRDVQALVGRNVYHKCRENGEVEWFAGRVEAVRVAKKEAIKTEYQIQYDVDPSGPWEFPLLMDLKKGDLVVV